MAIIQLNETTHDVDQVILCQGALTLRNREVELAIEFIATYTAQIIAPTIEEHVLDERASIIDGSWIARTHFLIKFEQRLIFFFNRVAVKSGLDKAHVWIGIHVTKGIEDALVRG